MLSTLFGVLGVLGPVYLGGRGSLPPCIDEGVSGPPPCGPDGVLGPLDISGCGVVGPGMLKEKIISGLDTNVYNKCLFHFYDTGCSNSKYMNSSWNTL